VLFVGGRDPRVDGVGRNDTVGKPSIAPGLNRAAVVGTPSDDLCDGPHSIVDAIEQPATLQLSAVTTRDSGRCTIDFAQMLDNILGGEIPGDPLVHIAAFNEVRPRRLWERASPYLLDGRSGSGSGLPRCS